MTTPLDRLALDYRVAFLRYLPRREETALHSGYELGREAVMAGLSVLDIARIHHEVFLEVLRDTRDEDPTALATAA